MVAQYRECGQLDRLTIDATMTADYIYDGL
jgi:hypothetical protein